MVYHSDKFDEAGMRQYLASVSWSGHNIPDGIVTMDVIDVIIGLWRRIERLDGENKALRGESE